MSLAGRTFLFNSDMAFSASAEEYSEFGSPISARTFLVADGTAYSMMQISNSGSEGVNEIVYTSGSVDTTVTAYNVDYQNPPYTYWTDDKHKIITFIIEPLPLRGKFTTSADIEQWVVNHSIEITTITSWSYEENGAYYRLRGLTLQDQQDIWSIRNKIDSSRIDAANGVAGLDTNGKVRSTQLPSEATTSASGFMSATDKTKLDGIDTGATAVEVVDNLTTDSSTKALSAAQGYALNSKSATEDLGTLANQSALETALVSLGNSMSNMQFKNIRFAFSAALSSGDFKGKSGYYIGTIKRTSGGGIYAVDVQNSGTGSQKGEHITGTYNGSTWTWMDLNDKFTRHSDSIGDNNLGITVSHVYNGSAHQILIAGTLTQALAASTKYELAPSTDLTNFVSYVPAYNFDANRWGYFYISNGKLCVQFRDAWASGTSIRYLLTWL